MAKQIRPNPMIAANDCIDFVAGQTDECILMCSLGKDSLVTLDMIAPRFKRVYAYFMYFVKDLEHINRWISWVKARYKNVDFEQIPHWNLTYILRSGLYCTPHPKQKLLKLADVIKALRLKHNCQWVFLGMKKADGMNRNLMITRFKDNHYTDNYQAYPLAEFSQKQILSYMLMHRIPEPVQYGLAVSSDSATVGKASNGIGFNKECLLWMRKYYPNDVEKIFTVFPLARRVLLEWDYQQEKEKERKEKEERERFNVFVRSYDINPEETGWMSIDGNITGIVAHFKDGHEERMAMVDFLSIGKKKKNELIKIDCYTNE